MTNSLKTAAKHILAFASAAAIAFSFSNIETVYADDSVTVTVSDADKLAEAVTVANSTIYVEAGTYALDDGLSIAANVKIIGISGSDGEAVIFDTGEYVKSEQAGLYISNDGVTFENITFLNSITTEGGDGSGKPVIKIEADDVSLTNCTIINSTLSSALVIHGSTDITLTDCDISNANTEDSPYLNAFSVLQINSKSTVYIYGGSINSAVDIHVNDLISCR